MSDIYNRHKDLKQKLFILNVTRKKYNFQSTIDICFLRNVQHHYKFHLLISGVLNFICKTYVH